ncbi:hypothetical protein JGH11_13255 [Dysgonomonas sp. Marseille-P4677]|uniref:hypothetical protein n=1 Tax=Dysgonomonas sp. Marseille-P4677 TaxID=2364790 RepID=UPI0019125044|nr:hypothetical protein [Dysgonomonas sp. Marseille-P4677]MBK5721841.1 hypothetical protein [Dysgonomonas sp. Marseille-P4677]
MKDESRINTIITIILITLLIIFCLSSCKTHTLYVPVESIKTEYKDRILHDSVYRYDSVLVKLKGDTVFFEKYKYLYRDKFVRDSIFMTDSIQVPYPIHVEKEVNRLSSFQSFQVWCGRVLLLLIIGWVGVSWVRKKFL